MPFGSVTLVPGVNSERTSTLLRAGITQASLIRFKDGLAQKYGGWSKYYPLTLPGVPRALHAWQDLNGVGHLAVATTIELVSIQGGPASDISPQTVTTNPALALTTGMGSPIVDVLDPNISYVSTYDSIFFKVPVSIGGLILDGLYPITNITGQRTFQITVPANATATTSTAYVPTFTTTLSSSVINVNFPGHGLAVGNTAIFSLATTGGGVTISGAYEVVRISDVDNFAINAATLAASAATFQMNGGNAEYIYYIASGPSSLGIGFGLGAFGDGGFGLGTPQTTQFGSDLAAPDWTLDNWGQILIACPKNNGLFFWDPTGGFTNVQLISTAPIFNSGAFVSMAQQILIAYGSSVRRDLGYQQQPLLVQWSTVGDFTNWEATAATQAGNFTIPIGSQIVGGMAVSNQNLLWTDLDLWAMSYIGPPDVFGFNKIGAGAGLVSAQAAQQFRGSVYWMGRSNFYSYTSNGAAVIPCPVWDAVFQNLNMNFLQNIRAMPNTPFNEVGWLYPSSASISGECDSYVKMNVTEPGAPWDYGPLARSAWIDQSSLGNPISATPTGTIYLQESSPDADGAALVSSFTTGYFYLTEGEDFVFIDQVLPDFKWETFNGNTSAQIQLTFNLIDNLGDTPRTYGPYTVTQATNFVTTRMRGRQMSITTQSSDLGSFWRLGHLRYRYSVMGRR